MYKKLKNYLETAKMKQKLAITVNIICIVFMIAILVAFVGLVNSNNNLVSFYHSPYENVQMQLEIRMNMQEAQKQVLWAVSTKNEAERAERIQIANDVAAKVGVGIDALYNNFSEQTLLEELTVVMQEMAIARSKALELAGQGKTEEALECFENEYAPTVEQVEAVLIKVGEVSDAAAEDAYKSAQFGAIVVFVLLIFFSVFAIVTGRVMAKLITKAVVEPVQLLQDVADNIAKGNFNVEVTYESEDEMGELAQSFKQTCDALKVIIGDLKYLLDEIKEGNFCVESSSPEAYIGDFEAIYKDINAMIEHQSRVLLDIKAASSQVEMGSVHMSESAAALAEGATEQASAVEELTATINDMAIAAESSADIAYKAYKDADIYIEQAAHGTRQMEELAVAMEKIDTASREIENIIGEIEDIASQTNLLSLNASIEAARAGEAGRGFAVVADQIGKLATDSARSAVNTRELISKCLDDVKNGNEATARTKEALNEVIVGIEKLADASRQSSDTAAAQVETIKEIETEIEQISDVVQNNSAAAQETSATSEELSAQAVTLNELVGQFRLTE